MSATDRFLPKNELESFFGKGKLKLHIIYHKSRWGKSHQKAHKAWLKRRFIREKTKEVIIY